MDKPHLKLHFGFWRADGWVNDEHLICEGVSPRDALQLWEVQRAIHLDNEERRMKEHEVEVRRRSVPLVIFEENPGVVTEELAKGVVWSIPVILALAAGIAIGVAFGQ